MKKVNLFLLLAVAAASLQSCGGDDSGKKDGVEVAQDINDKNTTEVSSKASDFMIKAASGGMMEVELGKLAQEKGVNPRVKEFGAMMVTDHTAANTEMKTMAGAKSVALPPTLGEDHQKHVDDLKQKSGAEFDKAYMDMMVDDHKEDISDFESATKLDDAGVKGFAEKTLPVLRKHLDSAQAIHSSIK